MSTEWNDFFTACSPLTIDVGSRILFGYQCKYRSADYRDCLFDRFEIPFPLQLENAVAKRRSDYFAGRVCAQRLLKLLGFSTAQAVVLAGANGEPIWPAGAAGSISHSAGAAICIATADPDILGIGIDIEEEIPLDIARDIKCQVVNSEEDKTIRRYFRSYSQGLTVVFSAKESIYKAAYRLVGCFCDFSGMRLVSVDASKVVFSVSGKLSDRIRAGARIAVNYSIGDAHIQTVACLTTCALGDNSVGSNVLAHDEPSPAVQLCLCEGNR